MPLDTFFSDPSIPRPRSILSRLSGPLASRSRNIAEFYIEAENPWKSYSPGGIVKGNVTLNFAKGFEVTHLVVCLQGLARVYKNQVVPGEGNPTAGFTGYGRGSRGVEYMGNGMISLFQDEIVLCGPGFLKKQGYKFEFELEFPSTSLPSSIEFERGSVSYFITSILTRPTTIAPTTMCHRRVMFQDSIDIANIPVPKPRTISLEPISNRQKVKIKAKHGSLDKTRDSSSQSPISRSNTGASSSTNPTHLSNGDFPPRSPAPSDISGVSPASAVSNSTQSFRLVHESSPTNAGDSRNSEILGSSVASGPSQTITATTEILRQGVLPGGTVPVRINITHTKPNIRGIVIVTLYRQGRIDMHPDLPMVSKGKNRSSRPEYEDVYPRSRTGLGGLYFSNVTPSSVHRKDLSQSSSMMVVNPHTLKAEIKTSVRVPDDAFPTMVNVPGEMIVFKYYVEAVIDVCGKLGEPRFLPRLTSQPTGPTFNGVDQKHEVTAPWANNILDTTQLRRVKNVVDCLFSLVVGSRDSSPRWNDEVSHNEVLTSESNPDHDDNYDWSQDHQMHDPDYGYDNERYAYDDYYSDPTMGQDNSLPATQLIPPPVPEEEVDEKTRLRQQEALLLPSQPPEDAQSSSVAAAFTPSAPFIAEEEGDYDGSHPLDGEAGPLTPHVAASAVSTGSVDTIISRAGPSRGLAEVESQESDQSRDDKQELEQRRLLAQASAPPTDGASHELHGPSAPAFAPTAPLLSEDDEYTAHSLRNGSLWGESLPQYHR